jgi:hypothetical protein
MRCWIVSIAIVGLALGGATTARACGEYGVLPQAAIDYIVENSTQPLLIEKLRAGGQEAIDKLAEMRATIAKVRDEEVPKAAADKQAALLADYNGRISRVEALMDQVGKQKYCSRSRLFWHTDLEAAKAAAQASGKPILSLRMLGNLDEEFSCANSRFFRTTLYANAEISAALRSGYVLHWKSVRPVPKVTIDFGDGRKLERTLTGNSIHYILTPAGEVVDALPGLYGPKAFLQKITDGGELAKKLANLPAEERNATLAKYHRTRFEEIGSEFASDLSRVQQAGREDAAAAPQAQQRAGAEPSQQAAPTANLAITANRIARPKARVESRLVAAALPAAPSPEEFQDEAMWQAIAALHAEESQLDQASRDLIRSENPTAAVAGRLAITKRLVEDPLVRLVRSLQESIALDTVRNEYQLHRRIHGWLADAAYRPEVETLNSRVYEEVFLTPDRDPWLGLAPADAYTALPNGGVVTSNR